MIISITLVGRISSEINLKFLEGTGVAVCEFYVAVNRKGSYKNKITDFYPVQVWGKYGESISSTLEKGQLITAIGSGKNDRWKDEDNKNYSKFTVIADFIKILVYPSSKNVLDHPNLDESLMKVLQKENIF